jgi:hypothetical protein
MIRSIRQRGISIGREARRRDTGPILFEELKSSSQTGERTIAFDGTLVGVCVGGRLGAKVGVSDRCCHSADGKADGVDVGSSEGRSVGVLEGVSVGTLEGISVGVTDGKAVGT